MHEAKTQLSKLLRRVALGEEITIRNEGRAIKWRLGMFTLPDPPAEYVPDRMASSGVVPLAVEYAHTLAVAELPTHHRDPFDRLLIAQAVAEGLRS